MPAVVRQVETPEDGRRRRQAESNLLKIYGGDSQMERWAADLLPEDELLALARSILFAPFASFRRWEKLQHQDVKHDKSCNGGHVTFSTRKPSDLTHDEWVLFKKITTTVSVANNDAISPLTTNVVQATAELVEHVGACSHCPAEAFGRAVSIRIEWAGRPLSREYSLEAR